MLAPYEWMKEYAAITSDPQQLADKMIMIGDGVEGIEYLGEQIENVVVGRIVSIVKHPNADKLVICQLDIGKEEPIQIVTGATNVFEGAYVPVAVAPALLPGGPIKKGKLRGEISRGMLCSGEELRVTEEDVPGAGVDGILILQGEPAVGTDICTLLNLKSAVLDFEVGANRPDCLSMVGIAREASAAEECAFTPPDLSYEPGETPTRELTTVDIEAPDLCTRYLAGGVFDVQIAESPEWMRRRLQEAGVRPINNIVDITNYVMLETGQPMHAFDADRIRGKKIIVRRAGDGETMRTLDGVERTFTSSMLLICDAEGPIGIAGVMGGLDSEISPDTKRVVFEAARFSYGSIRQTSRGLGLSTESSMRFSKGIDAASTKQAMERALHLVQQLGAGTPASDLIDVLHDDLSSKIIKTTGTKINAILGTSLTPRQMQVLLERVFIRTGLIGDELICTVPHFRSDIAGPADIAEEVGRMYGYDRIPVTEANVHLKVGRISDDEERSDRIRSYLVDQGFYECMTYPFTGTADYDRICRLVPDSVTILNPLGDDSAYMRRSLLPAMLQTVKTNLSRGNEALRLFELGRLFIPQEVELLPEERRAMSIAICGPGADFFLLKGILESLTALICGVPLAAKPCSDNSYSPAASAVFEARGRAIGMGGEISRKVAASYDLGTKVLAAEIDLSSLFAIHKGKTKYAEIGRFPAAKRDLAVVVSTDVGAGDVVAEIRHSGGPKLERTELLSVYAGDRIESGKKSVAVSLSFRAKEGTMKDDQIDQLMSKILHRLEQKFDAHLR